MRIQTLRALKDNFISLLRDERGGDVTVVDPGEAEPVLRALRPGERIAQILCTHHHRDHVGGVLELKKHFGAKVVCGAGDETRIDGVDQTLRDDETILVCGEAARVLTLPGHTKNQVAYYFETSAALFTGDTLFSAGCGRLFESTAREMWQSLRRIAKLPETTKIYFGHEYTLRNLDFVLSREPRSAVKAYREKVESQLAGGQDSSPSTLAVELEINPFLRAQNEFDFAEWRGARDQW